MNIKKFWQELNIKVKFLTILGLVLMTYGWLAKSLNIYFFWESSYIGYLLVVGSIGIIIIVELLIKIRLFKPFYRSGWRTLLHILFTGLIITVNVLFLRSDSLDFAKKEIKNDPKILALTGEITSFGLFVSGSWFTSTTANKTTETAFYELLVKGKSRFIMINVFVHNAGDNEWTFEVVDVSS